MPPGMGTPPPPWAACSNAWPTSFCCLKVDRRIYL